MINEGYLIPANTKKGQLIFGIFTGFDLIMFGTGVIVSVLLLLILGAQNTVESIICLLPALICGFLVLPLPNYRNVRTFIVVAYRYFVNTQKEYKWRGWCVYEQTRDKK